MQRRLQFNPLSTLLGVLVSSSLLAACAPTPQSNVSTTSPTNTTQASPAMSHSHGANHMGAMDLGPADENYDLRFIDAMILHHRGAIAMAETAVQQTKRPEIKSLGQAIITAQKREENDLMRKWRQAWYPQASETLVAYDSQAGKMMPMTDQQKRDMSMEVNLGAADDQFDLRFINAMIPHHEGAIAMANDALKKSTRPEIKQLSNEIITSQQAEIDQMKAWRKTWYNQ